VRFWHPLDEDRILQARSVPPPRQGGAPGRSDYSPATINPQIREKQTSVYNWSLTRGVPSVFTNTRKRAVLYGIRTGT
jgi:hypothetical protein